MDLPTQLHGTTLNLSDYLTAIKLVVDDVFDHDVWIVCEIRALSSKGGHYYFELAQTDDDTIIASCKATLWRYAATSVLKKFENRTQMPLTAGMKVRLKGRANFHTQYGFSFNINDIDPNFTLGELAATYLAMQQKLQQLGLDKLNKSLPTPFDLQHIIVIAPENAAGLGDFRADADMLEHTGACRFFYHHATFQGNDAPRQIRHAIHHSLNDFIQDFGALPDLLVIIRGGGAVGDLAYLNDYELAAMVAECPVPVWVGIGHERDTVILDEVAHTRFDTPSKVIAGIKTHLGNIWLSAKTYHQSIQKNTKFYLNDHQKTLAYLVNQIQSLSLATCQSAKNTHDNYLNQIKNTAKYQLNDARHQLNLQINRHKVVWHTLNQARTQLKYYQQFILSHHPNQTLNKGYALIYNDKGKVISSQHQIKQGMSIQISFKDGQVNAIITNSN